MVKVKPFAAIRPPKSIAGQVSARPYDVMNSQEARNESTAMSLLHITRPEIDFEPIAGEHEQRSYDKAVENYREWKSRGWLVKDGKEQYYIYAQTMAGRTQYGITLCVHADEYRCGGVKRHELTRRDKEDDRMKHILLQDANIEPVFLAFHPDEQLDAVVRKYVATEPEYDFSSDIDSTRHRLWVVDRPEDISLITARFESIPALYVADGHHRTAAAARVSEEKRAGNAAHNGNEEYNWFMAVCFPDDQLKIMDYNRVVKDLGGLTPEGFLKRLEQDFTVECKGSDVYRPDRLHNFSLYLEGNWYSLTARSGRYDDGDPIGVLDVTICSNLILEDILHIGDLRTSQRIDFVGGIRGLEELRRRVDSGEMAAAIALYPVSMKQLTDIADTGNIMPPKTTWFEPKLRSGLFIHSLHLD